MGRYPQYRFLCCWCQYHLVAGSWVHIPAAAAAAAAADTAAFGPATPNKAAHLSTANPQQRDGTRDPGGCQEVAPQQRVSLCSLEVCTITIITVCQLLVPNVRRMVLPCRSLALLRTGVYRTTVWPSITAAEQEARAHQSAYAMLLSCANTGF